MVTNYYLFNINTCFRSIEFAIFLLKYLHKKGLINFEQLQCRIFILNWPFIFFKLKKCHGWYKIHSFKLHVNPPYIEAISPHYITIFNEIQVFHLSPNILFLSHSPLPYQWRREQSKLNCRLHALDVIQTLSCLFHLSLMFLLRRAWPLANKTAGLDMHHLQFFYILLLLDLIFCLCRRK